MKTLAELLQENLTYMLSLNYSPFYIKKRRLSIQNFSAWLERTYQIVTVDRIRRKHLHAWQTSLLEHRTSKGRPFAATAINQLIIQVQAFLRYLAREGYATRSLAEALECVKEPHMLPTSVLAHAQVRKLLSRIGTQNTEGFRDRAMMELLYTSGVRVRELLLLDVGDVDLKNATALVMGKGRKQRMVPVGTTALKFLESYWVAVRPFLLKERTERAFFLDRKGKRLNYQNFLRRVHVYAQRAGLAADVTPHTFRRSCTTELIRGGANLYHVKELLGHEDLETLKHYAKLTILDLKKTHEKCHPRERDASRD